MRELSLFTGAGGGLLGTLLLGWTPIGYVEINDYCQRIIAQRIRDGILPAAPIFGDIRAFADQYARSYRGLVDVVTGGFPCQPFSVAGKRRAGLDKRNMWPHTIRVINQVQPAWVLLENVPGLLSPRHGYYGKVLRDLSEVGFDARWGVVSAGDCGAPHIRKRLWIVAYSTRGGARQLPAGSSPERQGTADVSGDGSVWNVADTKGECRELRAAERERPRGLAGCGDDVAHAIGPRLEKRQGIGSHDEPEQPPVVGNGRIVADAHGEPPERSTIAWRECHSWDIEPDICRVVDGCPARVHRLTALGNMQVPIVAATAWNILSGSPEETTHAR